MFEAGMFPGVMAQLSSWYRTDEMGKPVAWFFTIQTFANIVGSLLCYGISYINGVRDLSAWRWCVTPTGARSEATIHYDFACCFCSNTA